MSLEAFAARRDALLAAIVAALAADERVVALWLQGSLGRGEGDAVSDLDLAVVIADDHAASLCARPWMEGARTTPERLAFVRRFGEPVILHENHHNAPAGGAFVHVTYAPDGTAEPYPAMVDWTLVPLRGAVRPADTRSLFDKASVPVQPPPAPETPAERARQAADTVAFFWMMLAVTAKYLVRGDAVHVTGWLADQHARVCEVERLLAGTAPVDDAPPYEPPPDTASHASRIAAARALGARMAALLPRVAALGEEVRPSPMPAIETLLALAAGGP